MGNKNWLNWIGMIGLLFLSYGLDQAAAFLRRSQSETFAINRTLLFGIGITLFYLACLLGFAWFRLCNYRAGRGVGLFYLLSGLFLLVIRFPAITTRLSSEIQQALMFLPLLILPTSYLGLTACALVVIGIANLGWQAKSAAPNQD